MASFAYVSRQSMSLSELRPESVALFRAMSGSRAGDYIGGALLPTLGRLLRCPPEIEEVRQALLRPYPCLRAIYGHYAFARRGRDRFDLSETAIAALEATASEDSFGQFLSLENARSLWNAFERESRSRNRKPMEQLNSGVIAGMAELAQEIYAHDGTGSIAAWVVQEVRRSGKVEPLFLRMVDVRGIGPKITSLFLRDVAYLFGLEEEIEHSDRLYVQPIDKWIRFMAPYVINEPNAEDLADWILAGKLAKYARRAEVSGIKFNMGTSWFGMREVRAPEFFESAVRQVIRSEINPLRSSADLR
jgi:hypothetical protein